MTQLSHTLLVVSLPVLLTVGCAPRLPELPIESEQPVEESQAVVKEIQQPQDWQVKELEIAVLHKAGYNPFERDNGKSFRALNSLESYRTELGRHSIETAKPVDFRSAQILASSVGEKPSGGYKVTVTKLDEYEDRIIATVVQIRPGADCITTRELTHPFEFVLVPSLKPIEILEKRQTLEC